MADADRSSGRRTTYVETFDHGPGGWACWSGPGKYHPPEIENGVVTVRSPWGVDPNHAPPGSGYLTLITFIPTAAGLLYLAVVLDAFSRRIVGWAMANHLRTELVLDALGMAIGQRQPTDVIHHSDQGSQYTSLAFS